MERLITRLELDCALAIERVEGEKHGADRRREAVEAAAAATVTRRGKISGRFTRIGRTREERTKTEEVRQRRISRTERDVTLSLSLSLSLSSVQWQGERKQIRHVFKHDTERVWQVGSLANGAAEWQKLSLNDLSY